MSALGRLAIAVEADIASFTSDMGKVERTSKRTANEMERSLRRAAAVVATAVAAAGAAIVGFTRASINAADESAKMAQRVGVSVEALGRLKFAADQSGASTQQLQTALVRLARNSADAAGGLRASQEAFKALGVSVTDASGRLRTTEQIFSDVAEQFARMQDGAGKTAIATRLFGRAGAELIPMLNQGRAGLAAMGDEAERLGLVISTRTAKAAEQFNDNLSKLRQGIGAIGNDLAAEFLPVLVDTTNAMVTWFKEMRESGAIQRLVEGAKMLISILDDLAVFIITKMVAQALVMFLANITLLINAMRSAAVSAALLKGGIMALSGPIGIIASAVALLAVAIYNSNTAQSEAERVANLYAEATKNAESAVRDLSGATRDQIDEQIKAIGITRGQIQTQLDLAEANLAVAESQAQIAKQRALDARGTGGPNREIYLGTQATTAGMDFEAQRRNVEKLRASLFETDETYRELMRAINASPSGRGSPPIVDLTNNAQKAAAELARLREQAEAFANQTIMAMLQQFNPLLAIQIDYEQSLAKLAPLLDGTAEGERIYAEALAAVNRLKDQSIASARLQITELKRERDVLGRLNKDHAEQMRMVSMTRRELAIYQAVTRATAEATAAWGEQLGSMSEQLKSLQKAAKANAEELYDTVKAAEELEEILSRYDDVGMSAIVGEIEKVEAALKKAYEQEIIDPAQIARLQRAMGALRQEALLFATDAIGQGVSSLKSMASEGSSAYKAMEVAQAALNLTTAIGAIVNQGMGDPYTAFARMAAMAAAVSQLVGSIGSFSGGFSDTAAQRQATQGRGTVLGDAEAQSSSIANAIETTADATTTLVGISRGMLRALRQMQNAIGSATAMLARGGRTADFSDLPGDTPFRGFSGTTPSFLSDPLNLLGGSSRVTDQGIVIFGGALLDMLDEIAIGAYQSIESRSWRFGSRRPSEEIVDVTDDLGRQFQLIIGSIIDTVREAALALGLLPAEVEAALESYRIEEIRISLMDLDAEEQQQELMAVFGAIFDGLAGHVVPFIEQFQRVGEGLGETLVRVATSVQVTREAMRYLGLAIDEADPERFAQISVALVEMSGGIEEFISGMLSFVDKFAPEGQKFAAAQGSLISAFSQFGLAIPPTREAMWDLMQSLDATTESGREQISILLQLTDTADAYYSALERGGAELIDFMQDLDSIITGVDRALGAGSFVDLAAAMADLEERNAALIARTEELGASEEQLNRIRQFAEMRVRDLIEAQMRATQSMDLFLGSLERGDWAEPISALMRLDQQYRDHVETIHDLARESGRAAASEAELAVARRWHARQVQALVNQLLQSAAEIAERLGYLGRGRMAANDPVVGTELGGIGEVQAAVEDRYARELQLLEQLDQYVRGLGISSVSPLTPQERLMEAQGEYQRLLSLAQGGDLDAMAQLQGAADAYLREAQSYYGGVGDFEGIFNAVRDSLRALVDAGPQSEQLGPQTPVFGGPVIVEPGESFYSMNEFERALLAQQLVDHLAALSVALNIPILELMESLGIPLAQLARDLGIDIQNLTGQAVTTMAQLAYDLGLPLGELVTALGLELPDLAAGVRELATQLGIDLDNLTGQTAFELAGLARNLRTDLNTLTVALGIDLGRLTDVNSPIYQALESTLDLLSPDIRAELEPYLTAITAATNEADANQAIADAEIAINALPAGIRDLLAPFFSGVDPVGAYGELDYLRDIDGHMSTLVSEITASNGYLSRIIQAINAANADGGIPQYAQGTPWVPEDGPAMLHQGEMVIPRSVADRIRNAPDYLSDDDIQRPMSDRAIDELIRKVDELGAKIEAPMKRVANNTGELVTEAKRPKPQGRTG